MLLMRRRVHVQNKDGFLAVRLCCEQQPEGVEAVAVRYNLQILNQLHSSDVCAKGNNNGDGAALSYGLHVSVLPLS